jgi:murein DD-endopeptidase MepM/ murein hydrolase activator NlpD
MTTNRLGRRARTGVSVFFAAVAATVAVLLGAAPAIADPKDDQARVQRDLAATQAALETSTEQAEQAAVAFAEANRRLPEAQRALAAAEANVVAADEAVESATRDANEAATDLAGAEQRLADAQVLLRQTDGQIGTYSANAYKGGHLALAEGLLSVDNPADLVAALSYLERVAAGERKMLASHAAAEDAASAGRRVRASRKGAADRALVSSEMSVRTAQAAKAKAVLVEAQVKDLVAQREQALVVAEQQRDANQARLAELQAESDRIAADVRGLAANVGGRDLPSGMRLPMPVLGVKSSDFGMRYDPFYKVWQLHAGVDLAAPGGAVIRAAESGTVMRAGWNGGYGNYTCLYHGRYQGKGFATCYAHQSAILVAQGQFVRRGDVIGRVGTTGASTGNHLHFEVRLDGTPVDPTPWLPRCLC